MNQIGVLRAQEARPFAIIAGLCAAGTEDPRLQPLLHAWSSETRSRVEALGQCRNDWPALYSIAWSLTSSAHDFVRDELGPSPHAPLLALMLPLHFLTRQVEGWSDPPEQIPAPPLPHAFPGPPGETTTEARVRLTSLYKAQMAALDAAERAARGPGRMPVKKIDQLQQWGRWLYAVEIREPRVTLYELERAYHVARAAAGHHKSRYPNCGCKGTVRKALDQAKRYLAEWLDGGE